MSTLGELFTCCPLVSCFGRAMGRRWLPAGELVTSEPNGDSDSRYCLECVRAAIWWCARPGTVRGE